VALSLAGGALMPTRVAGGTWETPSVVLRSSIEPLLNLVVKYQRTMSGSPRLNLHQQHQVTRLRRTGDCVLAACIGLAMIVYRIGVANRAPTAEELLPGMAAIVERQRGILFGSTGVTMFRWFDALQEPAGQAGLVVALGIIGAFTCYLFAHMIEVEAG